MIRLNKLTSSNFSILHRQLDSFKQRYKNSHHTYKFARVHELAGLIIDFSFVILFSIRREVTQREIYFLTRQWFMSRAMSTDIIYINGLMENPHFTVVVYLQLLDDWKTPSYNAKTTRPSCV